jgi:hypothetical protein
MATLCAAGSLLISGGLTINGVLALLKHIVQTHFEDVFVGGIDLSASSNV